MSKDLYWDDVCYKKGVTDDGMEETRTYYSCYLHRDYFKHCNSKKYKKMYKAVQEDLSSIKCEHCNQKFSEEGYEIHCNRNKPLWDFQKIGSCMMMTCNNFKEDGKRYTSIDAYVASKSSKPKQKRTGVGKWSPVTGKTRPPNKPKGWASDKELQMKEHYSLCKSCDGMLNNTTWEHSDEDLMKLTSLTMCIGCEDEPNLELNVEDIKDSMTEWLPDGKEADGELKFKRNPNFDKTKKICIIKNDTDEPTEEEWELIDKFGTMLDFEEVCDTCNLPINDEDYSTRLLTYLDLDVCECD